MELPSSMLNNDTTTTTTTTLTRSNLQIPTASTTPSSTLHQQQQQHHHQHQPHVNYSSEHKVYMLSCAHCGCFISDRGMRAVLLLRPSITLFSTDGMPYNCGPLYPEGDDALGYTEQVERTCDCLTQSIGCFGCGNTIGYHIICPCSRCVDSVSKFRRAANGHRWVFHYGEVTSEERQYVTNEPGIYNARCITKRRSNTSRQIGIHNTNTTMSTDSSSIEERMNGEELRERELIKSENWEGYELLPAGIYDIDLNLNNNSNNISPHIARRIGNSNSFSGKFSLKQGDTIYWHHLISTGERPLPVFPSPPPLSSRPAR